MKKNALAALALAGVLVAMPVFALAASGSVSVSSGSSGGSGGGASRGSSTSVGTIVAGTGSAGPAGSTQPNATVVTVDANGNQSTGASTIVSARGTISVKTNGSTSSGTSISYDQATGNAVYGSIAIAVRTDDHAVAGLPQNVVDTNNGINAAGTMAGVVPGAEGSQNISDGMNLNTLDAATGIANDVMTEIILKVDYLDESMQNLIIGGYANGSTRYVLGQVVSVDYAAKLVTVRIPGSGTYWLAKR